VFCNKKPDNPVRFAGLAADLDAAPGQNQRQQA
jgi:hypothetical protein